MFLNQADLGAVGTNESMILISTDYFSSITHIFQRNHKSVFQPVLILKDENTVFPDKGV